MRALTALLLTDERPGHYHLSEGVIAAARRLGPVDVVRLHVQRRWSGRLLAILSNAGVPARWLLRSAYGLDPAKLQRADWIVSAGAETLAASIAITRLTGAPNVHYGSLRRYRPDGFRLVLTSYASQAKLPRHVMLLKPSGLALSGARVAAGKLLPGAIPQTLGLLIGGPSGECRFTDGDWQRLLAFIDEAHAAYGTRWVISNSRRTPAGVSDAIAARAAAGTDAIAGFIDGRATGPGTLGQVLASSAAIVCTDDSSSMISECVSAGFAVVGVRPSHASFTPDEQDYRRYLIDNLWYRALPIAALTPERLVSELARIRPLTEDPLDKLAGVLRDRIPELFGA